MTSYTFDPISRLASLADNFTGTANDQTATFTYNPASQIGSVTRTNDLYAWTGHGSDTTASTINELNQIAFSAGTFAYEARGNLTLDPTTGRCGVSRECVSQRIAINSILMVLALHS